MFEKPVLVSFLLGLIGGLVLIATLIGTTYGPILLIPDTVLVLAMAIYLRTRQIETFARRFGSVFVAFVLANLISIAYIAAAVNRRSLSWGQVWPLGLMLVTGAVIAAIVARLTAPASA